MTACTAGLESSLASRQTAWGLAAALLLANAAGYAFDLYTRFPWFDRVLHPATILALTYWLAVFVVRQVLTDAGRHRLLLAFVTACVGVATGAWWTVAERGCDQFVPGNATKGKYDTTLDLVTDTAGAMVAGLMGLRALRPARGSGSGA